MGSRFDRAAPDRAVPFGWWGHRPEPEQPITLLDLLRDQMLDSRIAAFLWMALEQHASLAVAATHEDAGKTTLLTALLDFLPADVETIYLRGWYERFDFFDTHDPRSTYLLCNEISDNLPTYLWGPGVRRLFEAAGRGFPLAATLHANNASEMVELLSSFPLEVPRELLSRVDLVLSLGGGQRSATFLRRLMRVELLHRTDDGDVRIEAIAKRDVLQSPLISSPGRLIGVLTERFGVDLHEATSELARREQFLERLRRVGLGRATTLRQALDAYLGN